LLRETGKHDCTVGATMEEFNPSELQEGKDFLQPMAFKLGYIFVYYYFNHAFFILTLVISRRSVIEFPSTQLYFMSAVLASSLDKLSSTSHTQLSQL
jgi:hypothetical protein